MHLAFAINNSFVQHLAACMVSILNSQDPETSLHFHILHTDITDRNQGLLESLKQTREFQIRFYRLKEQDFAIFPRTISHTSVETYFRLKLPTLLEGLDRALYLDADTICCRDLSGLWNTDLSGAYAGVVFDPNISGMPFLKAFGFNPDRDPYFNAGVLLFNLDKMRDDRMETRFAEIAEKYFRELKYQDQDLLNIALKNHLRWVSPTYNMMTAYLDNPRARDKLNQYGIPFSDAFDEFTQKPHVIHFTGNAKPWLYQCSHPFQETYRRHLHRTPWAGTPYPGQTLRNAFKATYAYEVLRSLYKRLADVFWKAAQPLHYGIIRYLVRRNAQSNFEFSTKPGLTYLTHISRKDPGFGYHENLLEGTFTCNPKSADVALIWGTRAYYERLRVVLNAWLHHLPLIIAEDGFVRSYDLHANGAPSLSCQFDTRGVYYDASMECSIDRCLNSSWQITHEEERQARQALDLLTTYSISKYNICGPVELNYKIPGFPSVVLVIDQRKGDQSISGAKADARSFQAMLDDAIRENTDSLILVKTHPDAISGGFSGYYSRFQPDQNRVKLLTENLNPISLLKAVDKVYAVSSQMGFEALFLEKHVLCYGCPFYSGWGLTEDRGKHRKRTRTRSLIEVFFVSYMKFSVYYNPRAGRKCSLPEILHYLAQKD